MSSSALTLPQRTAGLDRWKIAVIAAMVLLAPLPVIVAIHAGLYDGFMDNPLSGWGMWGTFVIYAALRPSRKEMALTVCLGLLFRVVYDLAVGEHPYPGSPILGLGLFLGLASLGVLIVRSLEAPSEQRRQRRRSLAIVGMLSYIGVGLSFYVSCARLLLPTKLDYFLYAFDGSLGFEPAFALGRLAGAFPPLFWTLAMAYNSFGFWFAVICAAHVNCRQRYRISVLRLLAANAVIGFMLYFLFPAMGPKYAFLSFPILPGGAIHPAPILVTGIPNAMPSLHFGGALLICWLARPWKWLYRATLVLVFLTALATMALGEHYFADLVVAIPYALAIFAFSVKLPGRTVPLAAGSLGVLLWLAFLRFGHFYPVVSWALVLATAAACFALVRRLSAEVWTPC